MADNREILKEACETFNKSVVNAKPQNRQDNFNQFKTDLIEGYRRGHFSTIKGDWDFYEMYERTVPKDVRDAIAAPRGSKLVEHGIDAMTSTMFPQLFSTTTTIGVMELTNQAPFNLAGYCGRQDAAPGQTDFIQLYDSADIVDDSENELEETQFYGVGNTFKISQIKRGKKKFAHAMTREMLTVPGSGEIMAMMRNGSKRLLRHRNRQLAKTLFGLWPYGTNPFPYIQDDVSYRSHYTGQNASPWVNAMIGNALDGTFRPFYMIESFMDNQTDPLTGDPVVNTYPDIFVMDALAADKARMGLGLVKIAYDLPNNSATVVNGVNIDPTNSVFPNGESPRLELNKQSSVQFGRVLSDRYVRQLVKQWYQDVVMLSAADAETAAHETYAVGDFSSLAWSTEWPEETLERFGTDTWDYFNQEVIFAIKYLEKADPLWKRPQGIVVNWPDLSGLTLTNFMTAYNASTGNVSKITGIVSGTASTANKFWF